MLGRISLCLILLVSPLFAQDLEVTVRSESSRLPVHIELKLDPKDAVHKKYIQTLGDVFANSLALGDRLHPIRVQPDSASTPMRIAISSQYPQLSFSIAKGNSSYHPICTLMLTQDIGIDRQKIHETADRIHHALTNIPGISSGKIIFSLCSTSKQDTLKQGELWSVDYDGGNLHPVTQDHSLSVSPHWANIRTHSAYFYVSYKLGIPKIFLGSLENPEGKKILHLPGNQFMPAFSPKKKLLAFVADTHGNPDLFLQSFSPAKGAMGKPRRLLNESYGTQGNPSFSPDGSKLVFVSNKEGTPRIYVMQIDPEIQTPRLLTKKYRNSSCPTWSPDGKKIAFCSVIKGVRQICIYDLSTGVDEQVTTTPINKESPSWAIDSHHLVYSAGNAGESEIYLLSLITKKNRKIAIGSGEKRFPAWGEFSTNQTKRIL